MNRMIPPYPPKPMILSCRNGRHLPEPLFNEEYVLETDEELDSSIDEIMSLIHSDTESAYYTANEFELDLSFEREPETLEVSHLEKEEMTLVNEHPIANVSESPIEEHLDLLQLIDGHDRPSRRSIFIAGRPNNDPESTAHFFDQEDILYDSEILDEGQEDKDSDQLDEEELYKDKNYRNPFEYPFSDIEYSSIETESFGEQSVPSDWDTASEESDIPEEDYGWNFPGGREERDVLIRYFQLGYLQRENLSICLPGINVTDPNGVETILMPFGIPRPPPIDVLENARGVHQRGIKRQHNQD